MNNFSNSNFNLGAIITGESYFNESYKMETGGNIDKRNGEIIIFQPADNSNQIEVRLEGETVWLTQKQMAELFDVETPAISKHIKNIY